MKYELDYLRDGSRIKALEDDKTAKIMSNFQKENSNKPHYAITITSRESVLRNQGIWEDEDARNAVMTSVINRSLHRISSEIENNYKRHTFANVRLKAIGSIEHMNRKQTHLVSPHIHGTLAVHPSWESRFLSLFECQTGAKDFSLSQDFWNFSMGSLRHEVSGIYVKPISDLLRWSTYCFKQVPHPELDINTGDQWSALVFTFNGLAKPKTNPNKEK